MRAEVHVLPGPLNGLWPAETIVDCLRSSRLRYIAGQRFSAGSSALYEPVASLASTFEVLELSGMPVVRSHGGPRTHYFALTSRPSLALTALRTSPFLGIECMQVLAGPNLGELGLSPCGRDDVALLPVEGERLLQGGRGLLGVVGQPEDLGEIHQRIGPDV
jgi:hypothetical protein